MSASKTCEYQVKLVQTGQLFENIWIIGHETCCEIILDIQYTGMVFQVF